MGKDFASLRYRFRNAAYRNTHSRVNFYDGYSYSGQTISELFAIAAPTKPRVVSLFLARSALQIVFKWASTHDTSR
jgi:hypothetical protein